MLFGLIATGLLAPAAAQDASSSSSPTHLRALAVYEYTGSYQKPARSRLVPVAIWDGTQFQPGSLYLANPEPLSVESGTLYELMKDGNGIGQIQVLRPEQTATGWIGLGKYLPNPPSGPVKLKLPPSLTAKSKFASDKPHFAYKPPADTGVANANPKANNGGPPRGGSSAESGRPTLHQRPEPTSGPSTTSSTTPAEEGRPTLHRSETPTPVLHHRTAAQQLDARTASPYPNRPHLGYTTKTPAPTVNLKHDTLTGLPPQMQQMAAISDPDGTTDHSYAWEWQSPGDKVAALRKMEILALKSLPPLRLQPQAEPPKPIHRKKSVSSAPELKLTLSHVHFHAFQLDYGSGPVYVFSAQSGAPGIITNYITLIAKPDFSGGLITLYKNVTSANLLDYQPRMRLIDAVDATGAGRADLLFDLLTRSTRQFALFRVQGGQAQEIFHTGPQ
jgi:hypothetical protein